MSNAEEVMKLLDSCKQAMLSSMEFGGTDWTHMIEAIDNVLASPSIPPAGEEAIDSKEAERRKRIEHDFTHLSQFFDKHGMPSMLKPSCLMCGSSKHEKHIAHFELPNIYICTKCCASTAPAVHIDYMCLSCGTQSADSHKDDCKMKAAAPAENKRIPLKPMGEDSKQWYFDGGEFYIDVAKDENGKYSIFCKDRKDGKEGWMDQAESAPKAAMSDQDMADMAYKQFGIVADDSEIIAFARAIRGEKND